MRSQFAEAATIQVLTIVFVGITGLCSPKRGWWVGKGCWNETVFFYWWRKLASAFSMQSDTILKIQTTGSCVPIVC